VTVIALMLIGPSALGWRTPRDERLRLEMSATDAVAYLHAEATRILDS
jgi:hypothetical protein